MCRACYEVRRSGAHRSAALSEAGILRGRLDAVSRDAVSFGGQMLLPLYLLSVRKITPQATGLLLAPAGLGMLCSYSSMGSLTERFGPAA
jgi:hypothetical protein